MGTRDCGANSAQATPPADPYARALLRMHFLTHSQAIDILDNVLPRPDANQSGQSLVDIIMHIMAWRDQRGDFYNGTSITKAT
eukprot:c31790_g1_i1 orf=1-246(-)